MSNARISSQNILQSPPKYLKSSNPDLYWLNPALVNVIDDQTAASFNSYSPYSYGLLTAGGNVGGAVPSVGNIVGGGDGFDSGIPELGSIESITGSIYKDAAGNKKAKYIIRVRNTGGNNVTGVDARIYNPYA